MKRESDTERERERKVESEREKVQMVIRSRLWLCWNSSFTNLVFVKYKIDVNLVFVKYKIGSNFFERNDRYFY